MQIPPQPNQTVPDSNPSSVTRYSLPAASIAPPRISRRREDGVCPLVKMALLLLFGVGMSGCGNPTTPTGAPTNRASAKQVTNAPAAKSAPESLTNATELHRSFFDLLSGGKDPFFPLTTRVPRSVATNSTAEAPPLLPISSYLKLTGLWPSKSRPMALINKSIFEPGDRTPVTIVVTNSAGSLNTLTVQVRCLEIRQESVKITIEGEPGETELRMPVSP